MRPIDPVVIREKRARLNRTEGSRRQAHVALEALGWFAEYAMNGTETGVKQIDADTLVGGSSMGSRKVPELITASSTPHVKAAEDYVRRAFLNLRVDILRRAIEMAQDDLDRAEKEMEK